MVYERLWENQFRSLYRGILALLTVLFVIAIGDRAFQTFDVDAVY